MRRARHAARPYYPQFPSLIRRPRRWSPHPVPRHRPTGHRPRRTRRDDARAPAAAAGCPAEREASAGLAEGSPSQAAQAASAHRAAQQQAAAETAAALLPHFHARVARQSPLQLRFSAQAGLPHRQRVAPARPASALLRHALRPHAPPSPPLWSCRAPLRAGRVRERARRCAVARRCFRRCRCCLLRARAPPRPRAAAGGRARRRRRWSAAQAAAARRKATQERLPSERALRDAAPRRGCPAEARPARVARQRQAAEVQQDMRC